MSCVAIKCIVQYKVYIRKPPLANTAKHTQRWLDQKTFGTNERKFEQKVTMSFLKETLPPVKWNDMMSYLFVFLGHLKHNSLDTVDAVTHNNIIFTLSFLISLFM